jgi:hypothetical protein
VYFFHKGYHWQMEGRNQEEGMLGQDGTGQHRDAQGKPILLFPNAKKNYKMLSEFFLEFTHINENMKFL